MLDANGLVCVIDSNIDNIDTAIVGINQKEMSEWSLEQFVKKFHRYSKVKESEIGIY